MLDILEAFLEHLKLKFLRIDGQTSVGDRQGLIDKFNSSKTYDVFLLSTKAGGLGINLTAANVVIFYDISYNYQVERQAEDRAHRLGQTKEVFVYRLITKDSVEENLLQFANSKKQLNDKVLNEGSCDAEESDHKAMLQLMKGIFK
jgi:SWI/SNF-related matrix-associated actin-dependent regulator 1 of chromatin subfamily A